MYASFELGNHMEWDPEIFGSGTWSFELFLQMSSLVTIVICDSICALHIQMHVSLILSVT